MNLSEIDPIRGINGLEMFVDSSDWVMVPNVYGMGTYSTRILQQNHIPVVQLHIENSDYKKG